MKERMICVYLSQAREMVDVLGNINIIGEYDIDGANRLMKLRDYLVRAIRRQEEFQREAEEMEAVR